MDDNKNLNPGQVDPAPAKEDGSNNRYIDALAQMKKTSVSKEDYQKLEEENKKLLDSLVNGNPNDGSSEPKEKTPIKDLRKKLMSGELNNLDYVKTSLELRNRVLEETGVDQYAGHLPQGGVSPEAAASAERVAKSLQELIDKSEGQSSVFTGYYQSTVQDVGFRRR